MLWTIIKKELLENLLNQRFAILLVLAALISWTSTFVLTKNYNQEVNEYYGRVSFQNRMIDEYFCRRRWDPSLMFPPKPPPALSSLARGIQKDWELFGSLDENPVPILFPFMDMLFVIGIIMSVAAITLSYDRISGEKETGTLRMLVIGSYPRARIMLGKWLGGLFSVVLILVIAVSGSVLIASILAQSSWGAIEWIALGALLALSALYCASFYSLGLYISAKTESPSDAIILSLLLWIVFTLIAPTLPPYLAHAIYPTPSAATIRHKMEPISEEYDAAIQALRAPYIAKGMSEGEAAELLKAETDKINEEYGMRFDELKGFKKSAVRELITALLHSLSPFSSYALAGAELTATGTLNQLYFFEKAERYTKTLSREYLPRKVEEAKSKDPSFTWDTKLDIRDRPRFQYKEEGIVFRLAAAVVHSLFLLIYTVLFFVLAWKAFLRYDVR